MHTKSQTQTPRPSRIGRRHDWRRSKSERGAIAIMTAGVLIIMIAMFGIALELSRAYNRKMELQSVVDATAVAAANALDGTTGGIDNAVKAAADTASTFSFSYNNAAVAWSPAALTFGTVPDGGSSGWVDGTSAKPTAGKVFFVRVDTSMLDPSHGRITNVLMPILSSTLTETNVAAAAVAGRDSLNVLPLAICAISNTQAKNVSGELVEYGFRRGISYDLMTLSNFLVNPIAPVGTVGNSMMGQLNIIGPYVCTGKMAIPTLQGGGPNGDITVEPGFPIGSLYQQLNSRFGTSGGLCQPSSAPADLNTRSFDQASASWIKSQPTDSSVKPLWSYAKAVTWASYQSHNGIEPIAGYDPFLTTDWGTLYPGAKVQSYPSPTPYQNIISGYTAYRTVFNTRVLRVPLLQCPVSTARATVLGVGKFFMTIPASSSSIYAEFAGMETWGAIGGNARLYR